MEKLYKIVCDSKPFIKRKTKKTHFTTIKPKAGGGLHIFPQAKSEPKGNLRMTSQVNLLINWLILMVCQTIMGYFMSRS